MSAEIAPGSVAVQMEAGAPRLVPRLEFATAEAPRDVAAEIAQGLAAVGEDDLARISLRISGSLKRKVDTAAAREQMSANAWITRAIAAALDSETTSSRTAGHTTMRGWAY